MPDDPFGGAFQKITIEACAASSSHRNQVNIVFASVVKEIVRRKSFTNLSNGVESPFSSLRGDMICCRSPLRFEVFYHFCWRGVVWTDGNVADIDYIYSVNASTRLLCDRESMIARKRNSSSSIGTNPSGNATSERVTSMKYSDRRSGSD